jgi:ribulose-phosphate 3-epimerase
MFDEPGGRESPYTGAVTAASRNVPGESQPEGPGALVPELIPELVVAPSLLAAGFLLDAARSVDGAADWLHVDIMDNRFVPNQTIGLAEVAALRAVTSLPFDTHLMIVDPDQWAVRYAEAGSAHVTFHIEASDDPVGLAKDIRAAGASPGLAIDRDTPVEPYLELLPHFDLLLVMTIKAGFGGQEFLPYLLDKIRTARHHRDGGHLSLRLEVDGGIAEDTIEEAAVAGADTFVAGTAVFGAADPVAAVQRLRALAYGAVRPADPRANGRAPS